MCGTFFSVSDCIALIGIIVNSALAIWIVTSVQNTLSNKRILKDHFIEEVKYIRDGYRIYLSNSIQGKLDPSNAQAWFKLMNMKIDDLMQHLNSSYAIDLNFLKSFQVDLRSVILESPDFMNQYTKKNVDFSSNTKSDILRFQQDHGKIFNDLIIKINES